MQLNLWLSFLTLFLSLSAICQEVEMLVEIPAGTTQKWEMNKTSGDLEIDSLDGRPRIINYLGYPANYGMIPNTILSKNNGGDGDPLDVILLGSAIYRGELIKVKFIGIMKLLDNGEQDDKLIAVSSESSFAALANLDDLRNEYPGVLDILRIWFTNYKGAGQMQFLSFGDRSDAYQVYNTAKIK